MQEVGMLNFVCMYVFKKESADIVKGKNYHSSNKTKSTFLLV